MALRLVTVTDKLLLILMRQLLKGDNHLIVFVPVARFGSGDLYRNQFPMKSPKQYQGSTMTSSPLTYVHVALKLQFMNNGFLTKLYLFNLY